MKSDALLTVTLPIELTNSNDGRGFNYRRTGKWRHAIESELRMLGQVRQPFEFPVTVHITRILGKGQRYWDADSILRGNSKELIDSLVAVGWFVDDSYKWITTVTGSQDDRRRNEGPAITITVERAD